MRTLADVGSCLGARFQFPFFRTNVRVFLNRGYAKRKQELLGAPMSLDHNSSVST